MSRFEFDKNSYSRYLGRNFKMLVELKHSIFANPYCFINDTKELYIDDVLYSPFAFDVILPSQTETQGTQIVMSNIQNLVANEIKKTIYSNENILVTLFFANIETEVAERYDIGTFELQGVNISPESVTGTINIRTNLNVNVGAIRYNSNLFPNLFL